MKQDTINTILNFFDIGDKRERREASRLLNRLPSDGLVWLREQVQSLIEQRDAASVEANEAWADVDAAAQQHMINPAHAFRNHLREVAKLRPNKTTLRVTKDVVSVEFEDDGSVIDFQEIS